MSAGTSMEPQTYGLIVFKTTFGDLEVELFTQQCPKLTKNFVQLCLDGYYQDTIFNHVEKDFIAIGGVRAEQKGDDDNDDPLRERLGTTLKDEFHSRLRFTRRGLLATANKDKDTNGPEFFFTLGPTQELQNKHSIFGRLRGNSVYSLVDLNECQVDQDLRPLSEKKINQVNVVECPFPELEPRAEISALLKLRRDKSKRKQKIQEPKLNIKSNKTLSFYEDEEDETESTCQSVPKDDPNESKESRHSQEHDTAEDESKRLEDNLNSGTKRFKLEQTTSGQESAREVRLREIREQIKSFKKQLESAPEGKDEVQKKARELPADDTESGYSRKSKHERERETRMVVDNFKRKLKEASRSGQIRDTRPAVESSPEPKRYDDDDARLLAELNSVDDDSWLVHKFVPAQQSNAGAEYSEYPKSSDREQSLSHNGHPDKSSREDSRSSNDRQTKHSNHRHHHHHRSSHHDHDRNSSRHSRGRHHSRDEHGNDRGDNYDKERRRY